MLPIPSLLSVFTEEELKQARKSAKASVRQAPRLSKKGRAELARLLS